MDNRHKAEDAPRQLSWFQEGQYIAQDIARGLYFLHNIDVRRCSMLQSCTCSCRRLEMSLPSFLSCSQHLPFHTCAGQTALPTKLSPEGSKQERTEAVALPALTDRARRPEVAQHPADAQLGGRQAGRRWRRPLPQGQGCPRPCGLCVSRPGFFTAAELQCGSMARPHCMYVAEPWFDTRGRNIHAMRMVPASAAALGLRR